MHEATFFVFARQFSGKWLRLLPSLIVVLLLFKQFNGPTRDLLPPGESASTEAWEEATLVRTGMRLPDAVIAPSSSLFHGAIGYEQAEKLDPLRPGEESRYYAETRPQWFAKRFVIDGKTSSDFLDLCADGALKLKFSGKWTSQPAACKFDSESADSDGTYLISLIAEFTEPIFPGRHSVHLLVDPHAAERNLRLFIKIREFRGGSRVLVLAEKNRQSLLDLLVDLTGYDKSAAVTYVITLVCLSLFPFFATALSPSIRVLALILIVAAGSFALTPKFSGNDETAHVHYMFTSAAAHYEWQGDELKKETERFYDEARNEIRFADFYQLHGVEVIPVGECPHSLLAGGCGSSAQAQEYYDWVYSTAAHVGLDMGTDVNYLIHFGRVLNAILLLLSLALALSLQEDLRISFFMLVLSCGSLFSLLPSLSNDFVIQILSILLVLILLWLLRASHSLKSAILATGVVVLVFAISKVDLVGVLVFHNILIVSLLVVFFRLGDGNRGMWRARELRALGLGVITSLFVAILSFHAAAPVLAFLKKFVAPEQHFTLLTSSITRDPLESLEIFWMSIRSFVGTFVWDHYKLDFGYYAVVSVFLCIGTFSSLVSQDLRPRVPVGQKLFSKWYIRHLVLAVVLGLLLGAHFAFQNAVVPSLDTGYAWVFTVWRLYAPNTIGFGLFFCIGFFSLYRMAATQSSTLRFIVDTAYPYSISLYLICVAFPQMFLAERY